MASDVVSVPEQHGIETHGIERVSPKTRTHVRIFDNFTMWLSANLVISTVALGSLAAPVFQLGFWDSVAVIIVANILGTLPVAFFSTLGPKLGLRQMTIARFAFGWVGGIIMALFNIAACIGWSAVNVIVGGQLAAALVCGNKTLDVCSTTVAGLTLNGIAIRGVGIVGIAILTTLVSIYGYKYVHRYERFAWIPLVIIFAIMLVVAGPHFTFVATPAWGPAEIAGLVSFGAAIYGFATGWSSYAADYNVNQPENTSPSRVFWLTFLGVFIPCALLEIFGLALTTTTVPASNSSTGGSLLAATVQPLGAFGNVLIVLLALSIIANNIPNDYSLGLCMQVLGRPFQRVNRAIWTLCGAVVYVLIAIPAAANFNETLTSFLLLIAYWLGPWAIIMILEHFIRGGKYNVDDWNTPSKLPVGWAAIVAMALGLVGVYLGFAQSLALSPGVYVPSIPTLNISNTGFCAGGTCFWTITGPLGSLVNPPPNGGGMDIGFEIGVVFAFVAFLILRRVELSVSKR